MIHVYLKRVSKVLVLMSRRNAVLQAVSFSFYHGLEQQIFGASGY